MNRVWNNFSVELPDLKAIRQFILKLSKAKHYVIAGMTSRSVSKIIVVL